MKNLILLLITTLTIGSANAAWVCYPSQNGSGLDCFHSNGSCEYTFGQCTGLNGSGGCSCDPNAYMPCNSCPNQPFEFTLSVEDGNYIIRNIVGTIIATANMDLFEYENYQTGIQFEVNTELNIVSFSIFDMTKLNQMAELNGAIDKEQAFLQTINISIVQ